MYLLGKKGGFYMRKNINHDVHIATTRNELIDLINSKYTVIEVTSSALDEFDKEYKEDKMTNKGAKTTSKLTAFAAALGIFNPATTIPTLIFLGGTSIFMGLLSAGCDYKNYALAVVYEQMETHTLLIRYSEFDDKLDTIEGFEHLSFSKTNKCPNCGKKIKVDKKSTNPTLCYNCRTNVVVYYK